MDVGVVLMNSTTIKVTWAAVDRETVRGHLLGYKVLILYLLCCLAQHIQSLFCEKYIFGVYSGDGTYWLGRGFCEEQSLFYFR